MTSCGDSYFRLHVNQYSRIQTITCLNKEVCVYVRACVRVRMHVYVHACVHVCNQDGSWEATWLLKATQDRHLTQK